MGLNPLGGAVLGQALGGVQRLFAQLCISL